MNVLMVDDHVMFLQGMRSLLGVLAPQLKVDVAESISQAARLACLVDYELVLLDWNLEDGRGKQAIDRLREVGCIARIVVLSGETDSDLICESIEVGAAGFIPKRYSSELMISALNRVIEGQIFLPPEALHDGPRDGAVPLALVDDPRLAGLTPRQIDVFRVAARGLPNKLIARELGIAESTVKSHLSAVFAALGVRNRTEAAYLVSREGTTIG